MDTYYERYRGLEDVPTIAADIVKMYHGECSGVVMSDMGWFTDWEKVCGNIMFRLVNTEWNAGTLAGMPHLDMPELGLSMTCYIALEDCQGMAATISVQESHMKVWGVTEDEIVEQAWRNTPGQRRVLMRSILEVICGASGSGEGQYPEAFRQMPMLCAHQ